MAKTGFAYSTRDIPATTVRFLRYGVMPEDDRSSYTGTPAAGDVATSPGAAVPAVDNQYTIALYGAVAAPDASPIRDSDHNVVGAAYQQGGCLGQAEAAVAPDGYADYQATDILLQTLLHQETHSLWTDARTIAAIEPWIDCMASSGAPRPSSLDYYVATYEWTGNDVAQQSSVIDEERQCKARTDVLAQVFTIDFELQSKVLESNSELFRKYAGYALHFAAQS